MTGVGTSKPVGMTVTEGDRCTALCPCGWESANVENPIAAAEQLDRHQRTVCKRFIR